MRFAFLMYCWEDHATTSMSFWLSRELIKRGHQATLIAVSRRRRCRPELVERDGVRLFLTPRGFTRRWHIGALGFHDIASRLWHFARHPYDVMIASDCRANVYLPFRAMQGRIPLRIANWGDRWGGGLAAGANRFATLRRLEEKWEKDIKLEADGVITTSQTLGDLGREWGIPGSRLCWIPHGSSVELIQSVPKPMARSKVGLEADQPVIGYMGHGLGTLPIFFPTLSRVVRRHPRTTILSIGSQNPRDLEKVEQAGLSPHFRFTGFVPVEQLNDWLACADLFLIALSHDSVFDYYRIPGKLGEYMAAGRPVVAPDIGETGRILREEKIGLLLRSDLSDLEEKICALIENPALAEQLGRRARQVAEEKFSWSVLTDRFEQFVATLRNSSAGSQDAN